MEQFFTSLSKRQTMLLLTSLAFGGSQAVAAYEHLPLDEEELLKHRAAALLQISRDKRIPLLVQEIKRLIIARRKQLAFADPKRLAEVLRQERPALVEVVLGALPVELADSVRAQLGPRKTVRLTRDVRPDVLSIIRWKLEDALKVGAQIGVFRFTDLVILQQREVLAVADRMGARVLATALAGLPEAEREALLAKLPPDQRALAARAAEAGKQKRLSLEDAKTVLEMHNVMEKPSVGLRSAGVQRIARACLAQSPEFAQRMVERHPGELGKMLVSWIREERPKPIKGDGGRADIVEQLERLAQKGVVDRPMRLPPPIRPPPAPRPPAPPAPVRSAQAAGRASARDMNPQEIRASGPPRRQSVVAVPTQQPPARRDPIAEREARRAGAVGSRPRPEQAPRRESSTETVPPHQQRRPGPGDAKAEAPRRIMRDGKPLERDPGSAPKAAPRRGGSGTVDERRRRERTDPSLRSPVLKGPGRGPSGGSR